MEIFTGESIAEQLTEFGTPCEFLDKTISPQIVKYDFALQNILQLQRVKRLMENLSALLGTTATFCNSDKGHFAIQVNRKERELIKLNRFANILSQSKPYSMCFGLGDTGEIVIQTLDELTHLLVSGTTGSGKSVALNSIITSLISNNYSSQLALILIDPKQVEFNVYENDKHLMFDPITTVEQSKNVLTYLVKIMEERYSAMKKQGIEKWQGQKIVVVIDELADLVLQDEEIKPLLIRLLQKARASGIHIICGTQTPRAKILDGTLLANIPSRLCLTCSNQRESILILGHSGGEKLTGNGDAIFKNSNSIHETRLQTPYISRQEIKSVVDVEENNIQTPHKKQHKIFNLFNKIIKIKR